MRVDRGEELMQSTLEAVRLTILRPIIMTSMAFILGVMPLVLATGAGAVARNTIGFTVLGGMIASTTISIFIVPVLVCAVYHGFPMVKNNWHIYRHITKN